MRIGVGVLGPIRAERDGRTVDIGGPQRRRLLAVLCSDAGRVVPVARLVSAMWPDDDVPDGAERTVMTYVSRLRAAVAPEVITSRGVGYVIEPELVDLDRDRFEALCRAATTADPERVVTLLDDAIAMWRGPAFGEFAGEWWAHPEAARLEELRIVAAEERVEAMLVLGRSGVAVSELEALTAAHPLRERPVALLMRGLQASGRPADALRAFQTYRRRLAEETGLDPSADLVELDRSIASGTLAASRPAGGRALRGYVLTDVLGEGAHGRVYAAIQPGTGRTVAVKVVRSDVVDSADFVRRFEAEARVVARLEHPHIVPMYDHWREPGGAYLVFRLLRGGTVAASLAAGGAWSAVRVSRLVEEVGAALVAAHAAGIAHGDVKASNVLLDEDGNTYLSDFGIAGVGPPDTPAPSTEGRRDIAAFAALLWELLVGRPPATTLRASAHPPDGPGRVALPSLVGHVDGLPVSIDAVLARATTTDARGGFESIAELIVAWRAAVGRPDGVLTPIDESGPWASSSSRRRAARQLALQVAGGSNPFTGLRPFDEADADRFFGRDTVADALRAAVGRNRFVTVVGPSGCGKTSVVRAGLVPRLRSSGCVVASMTPGERPLAALRAAISEVAVDRLPDTDPVAAVAAVARSAPGALVVLVDQFEECWTVSLPDERDEFLTILGQLAEIGDDAVRLVVTVRADHYDRPLQHALVGSLVGNGTFPLVPLTVAELEMAISLPIERTGTTFDDGVVAALVADASKQAAPLPLLQFTLAELYERRVEGRIQAASLDAVGGLAGAVAARAAEVYEQLDDHARAAARILFRRLVAPGHGTEATRRRARLSELSPTGRDVAERFIGSRLLVGDRDPTSREPVVEVAHEALLSHWPRLHAWLEADRQWIGQLQHLAAAASAWDDAGRPDGELYRGSRLEAAIEALPERGAELAPVEAAFVEAGRAARDAALQRERRSARRLRRLLVAVAVALVVALAAGGVATVQRGRSRDSARAARAAEAQALEAADQAAAAEQRALGAADDARRAEQQAVSAADEATAARRDAEIEALVGRIASLRTTQRDTAALLAVEAFLLADTPRTRSALLSTFTHDPGLLDTHRLPPDHDLYFGIVLPDGERALVTTRDHRLRPYALDTGELGEPWAPMSATELRFTDLLTATPDSRLLAHVADNEAATGIVATTVGVFDIAAAQLRFPAIELDLPIGNATFSPDGSALAVSGGVEEHVIVYDTSDGQEVGRTVGPDPREPDDVYLSAGLAFVGDDRLAIGSARGAVRIVELPSLAVVEEISAPAGTSARLVALDGGRGLLGTGPGGAVRLDVSTGATEWSLDDSTYSCEDSLVIESTGSLFCADVFGRMVERDLAAGDIVRRLDAQNGAVGSLWPARGGTELVSFGNNEASVTRWRLDGTGPITRVLPPGYSPAGYSPDGTRLAAETAGPVGEEEPSFVVLDAGSGQVAHELGDLVDPVWVDDRTVRGLIPGQAGLTTAVLDVATSSIVARGVTLPYERFGGGLDVGGPLAWVFYPRLTSAGEREQIWTIDTSTLRRIEPTIDTTFVVGAGATADGSLLAVGQDDIAIFDTRSGEEVGRIERDGERLRGVHITDTGVLIAWTLGGEATIYDLATLEPLRTLPGNRGYLQIVESDTAGSIIASLGGDRSVAIHDLATGVTIGDTITISDDEVNGISLRPDGLELAVGGSPQAGMQIWDLDPQHWIEAACRLAGRNLTPEEWATNIGGLLEYRSTCRD